MNKLASELCNPVVSVNADTTIENVLKDIDWSSVSSVVVLGDNKHVVGIITEQDMIYAESIGVKKSDLKAWEICTKEIIKISPDETVSGAMRLMVENKVHHVLVMTGDYLEGIISTFDVLKELMKDK